MEKVSGKILISSGGFYTVETPVGVVYCSARGIFRTNNISPTVGDNVLIELEKEDTGIITDILPRRNYIVRPPMANIDIILIIVSSCEPPPNAFVLDKLIAIFENKQIEPVLVFTKSDKFVDKEFISIYESANFQTFTVDNISGTGFSNIVEFISGKVVSLIGNSGVGKSSFLNILLPTLNLTTAEISRKLGRGKHTTRGARLYPFNGGYIADTAGFSTVDVERYGNIPPSEIQYNFREFEPYLNSCKFADCVHIKETGCKIKEAVAEHAISESRYGSYVKIYAESKIAANKY